MFFSLKIFNIQHFLQTRYVVVAHCYSQVLAVGINLLAPVSNLPNHIPVNNREMFLLAIPSDRNLKIHTLSNAFFNLPILSSTSSSLICICLIFFQLAGREILKQHYHLNGGLYQLQSVSDITIQLFLLLFIHSLIQSAMVFHVFPLLCLFSCFVCGPRFQIPHRGPESRCLVQWLRRQSCTNIFYFGKSQKLSVPHILSHLAHLRWSKSRNMLRALNMRGGGLDYLLSLFEHYLAADPLPFEELYEALGNLFVSSQLQMVGDSLLPCT